MENPSASECTAADRSDDDRDPVRNDIGVDGGWKHQRFREGASRRRPTRTCGFSIRGLAALSLLTILQLEGVARGLIYIHSQGMIHGDLKGVRCQSLGLHFYLTDFNFHQGQHPDRPDWPCPPRRLWSAYDHLGSSEPFVLEFLHTGWHSSMDEPGAYRSTTVRIQEHSSNDTFGLLCTWNGGVRNYQRTPPVPPTRRLDRFLEGPRG
jgi:hypothetical protein